MTALRSFTVFAFAAALFQSQQALSHGVHEEVATSTEKDWATRHMQVEHHISNFDPVSFFKIHDYDSDGYWEPSEIRRTYGFDNDGTVYDGSGKSSQKLDDEQSHKVVADVLELYDENEDVRIDLEEWKKGIENGKRLPDFGLGPGHHGDDEYEYEIHHFERYHDENTRQEDLTHPEDILHFAKHDQKALQDEQQEKQTAQVVKSHGVVDSNIPPLFRRSRPG